MNNNTIIINTKILEDKNLFSNKYTFLTNPRMYIASGIDDVQASPRCNFTIETSEQNFAIFILELFATKKINCMEDIISIECFDYQSNKKICIPNNTIRSIRLNQFSVNQPLNTINFNIDLLPADNTFITFEDIE